MSSKATGNVTRPRQGNIITTTATTDIVISFECGRRDLDANNNMFMVCSSVERLLLINVTQSCQIKGILQQQHQQTL